MDYTTLTPLPASLHQEADHRALVTSLYEMLRLVPDERRGQGKRYSQALLIALLVLAKLAGQTSLSGATEWVRHRATALAAQFGLKRVSMPCQMTYCRMLARLDAQALDDLLAAFFTRWETQQRCGEEPSRSQTNEHRREHAHLAIDGKMVRATSTQEEPTHLLSCYDVTTGTVLWQSNVGEKQNEISALKPLITPSLVKGRIFTLDAMHTQREFCAQVDQYAGGYILIAKENQPTLHEDIVDFFEDRTPDRRRWTQAETWEKGHGRIEHRQIVCSPDLADWFAKQWAGITQVFRLERTSSVLKTGQVRHQIVYGISNLSVHHVSAQRLLELIRQHWFIENRLHWRRDVTLGEDGCQSRTGQTPQILARLNSTILSMMDRLGVRNVARQIRFFDGHIDQAIQLLLTGQCDVY